MGARILQRTLAVVEVGGKFTAAREMDTDAAPTELEDEIDYDGSEDRDEDGLVAAAEGAGWKVVARAPAGEYWTVLVEQ